MDRRSFIGSLCATAAARFLPKRWQDHWRPADLVFSPPKPATVQFWYDPEKPIEVSEIRHAGQVFIAAKGIVIGQYADYYPLPEPFVNINVPEEAPWLSAGKKLDQAN